MKIQTTKKDVIWNYLGYGITFGINILLLPLVLAYLKSDELGLWYVFLSIGAFVTLLDFGFAPQISRNITYALSGVNKIVKFGIDTNSEKSDKPNYDLLSKLLASTKLLYLAIAVIALILLSTIGSYYIVRITHSTLTITQQIAWVIFVIGCFINLYYSYYNSLYRGIGQFVDLNKAIFFSRIVQLIVSVVLLKLGYGILAVASAYTFNTLLFRILLFLNFKKSALSKELNNSQQTQKFSDKLNLLRIIWHNAWRDGLVTISNYVVTQSNTLICSAYFGLSETASYALSVQIVTFITTASTIFFSSLQPSLSEASLNNNNEQKKHLFSIGWSFFILSFIVFFLLFYSIGIPLLSILKSNTELNPIIFALYALLALLTTNYNLAASYISASNRLPYAASFIISALFSIFLALTMAHYTNFGIFGLILSHLIVQTIYNIWKWPLFTFKELMSNPLSMIKYSYNYFLQKFRFIK